MLFKPAQDKLSGGEYAQITDKASGIDDMLSAAPAAERQPREENEMQVKERASKLISTIEALNKEVGERQRWVAQLCLYRASAFAPHWTSHLRRSPSNHGYGHAFDAGRPVRCPFGANAAHCSNSLRAHSSADQPNCFARHALIPKPFIQFAS
jgi:hypothetical protein